MDQFLERSLDALDPPGPLAREVRIHAADGVTLAATVHTPRAGTDPSRYVVINSATGVARRYYARFASYLADAGFTVVTYDYRGIGGSRPRSLRGFRATMRDWGARDFDAVLAYAEAQGARAPLVVAHSVGGQVAPLASRADRVRGFVFVGAQLGDVSMWPPVARLRVAAFFYAVVPALTSTLGYLPGGPLGGEDLPYGVARQWARWARRPRYLAGGPDAARVEAAFARITAPVLAYGFDDDDFAPRVAVDALLGLYRNADAQLRWLAPAAVGLRSIGHFGFFREKARAALWPEARAWLLERADGAERAVA